ncbi:MAG: D-alanyl-D-alanine carboxypeptidase [Candidatus Paracaedibacteraceae bacterium]|nr:D-alanyl-D-alanine carboxypeptidase [Candidatus Paracaedibacteraceae bacterium]
MKNRAILSLLISSLILAAEAKPKKSTNQPLTQPIEQVHSATLMPEIPGVSPVIAASLRIDTLAEQAIVLDYYSGKILLEKNADAVMAPSSMTKILTAYMAFEKMQKGVVGPDSSINISEKAWRTGGSRMFLKVNTQATVDELLHGIIIQSGNDASVALAEGLSGSEEAFAAEMTQKAHELGCTNTTFKNASGLPDPEHKTTARDLAKIAYHVIRDYPQHYPLFAKTSYTYGGITQPNRHPLLNKNVGCDGLKTGMTDLGGYGVVISVQETDSQNNHKRFIIIINGLKKESERAKEALKLSNWVLKAFTTLTLAKKGLAIQNAPVYSGTENTVPVAPATDAFVTVPTVVKDQVKYEIKFDEAIAAPIAAGQTLGKLIVNAPMYAQPIAFDLVATKNVEKAGIFKKTWRSITHIFGGKA